MRYYRRTGRYSGISTHITVWRRIALAVICLLIAGLRGNAFVTLAAASIGIVALASAIRVAVLKIRTTTWPT